MAKILIAEDDESMLNFLRLALERAGHDVIAEINGSSALEQFYNGKESFDLLLTDIVMPGIDGVELAKKITEQAPNIKVMFITGFAGMSVKNAENLQSENANLLSKPFHLNELVEQVETLLEKQV